MSSEFLPNVSHLSQFFCIHYEYGRQRKRTKYTVTQVDKGTSLHCYYVERWICMWHLFYTFLHNSSEGMFLCLPGELYILSAFFVSHLSARAHACTRQLIHNRSLLKIDTNEVLTQCWVIDLLFIEGNKLLGWRVPLKLRSYSSLSTELLILLLNLFYSAQFTRLH